MATHSAYVRDADEQTFEREVIERSHDLPVVVDFWAAWCGPCRTLGPLLERLAASANGTFELVKVDVDHNPRLAQEFRVQGIPAVKAFRDGRVVSEFVGALPEPRVRAWLDNLAPSEADRLIAAARAEATRGDAVAAERLLRQALAADLTHKGAALALAALLVERAAGREAGELLDRFAADPEAQRLRSRLRFRDAARATDIPALRDRLEANPNDAAAHYELGLALAGDDAVAAAFDHLLQSIRLDRRYANDAARKAMLELFALLGDDDPRTREYRRQLSSLLF